jgi:hypothetical protein
MKKIIFLLLGAALVSGFAVFMSCEHEQAPVLAPTASQDEIYVPPEDICRALIASQDDSVGTVCVSFTSECLNVTYTITIPGMTMSEVQLWVDDDPSTLPCAGGGTFDPNDCSECTPVPGQFPYSSGSINTSTYTICVPLDSLGITNSEDCESTLLYLVAHATVGGETAFADGVPCNVGTPGRWYFWDDLRVECRLNPPTITCASATSDTITLDVEPGGNLAYVDHYIVQYAEVASYDPCTYDWELGYTEIITTDNDPTVIVPELNCGSQYVFRAMSVAVSPYIDSQWSENQCCCTAMCPPVVTCVPGATSVTITVSGEGDVYLNGAPYTEPVTYEIGCGQSQSYSAYVAGDGCHAASDTVSGSCCTNECPEPSVTCYSSTANSITLDVVLNGNASVTVTLNGEPQTVTEDGQLTFSDLDCGTSYGYSYEWTDHCSDHGTMGPLDGSCCTSPCEDPTVECIDPTAESITFDVHLNGNASLTITLHGGKRNLLTAVLNDQEHTFEEDGQWTFSGLNCGTSYDYDYSWTDNCEGSGEGDGSCCTSPCEDPTVECIDPTAESITLDVVLNGNASLTATLHGEEHTFTADGQWTFSGLDCGTSYDYNYTWTDNCEGSGEGDGSCCTSPCPEPSVTCYGSTATSITLDVVLNGNDSVTVTLDGVSHTVTEDGPVTFSDLDCGTSYDFDYEWADDCEGSGQGEVSCCTSACPDPSVTCSSSTATSITLDVVLNGNASVTVTLDGVSHTVTEDGQVTFSDLDCGTSYDYSYTWTDNCEGSGEGDGTCCTDFCAPTIECTDSTQTTVTFTVISPNGALPDVVWISVDGEPAISHNLTNGSVTIETGDLNCGQSYEITAYFEASGCYAQSATTTHSCSTSDCEGGCAYTFGYWKTHYPGAWPVEVQENGLTINGINYTAPQLENILRTPPRGNAVIILGHQLIGALLNQWNGASPPHPMGELGCTMEDVYQVLGDHNLLTDVVKDRNNSEEFDALVNAAACLDQYNNGQLNIPHCESSNPVCGRCIGGPPDCRVTSEEICNALNGDWTQGAGCPKWQIER